MENSANIKKNNNAKGNTAHDYFSLVKNNIALILIITLVFLISSVIYSIFAEDVYKATTTIKISKPKGSILDSFTKDFGSGNNELFIANEIETITNITIREKVAQVILDSVKTFNKVNDLDLMLRDDGFFESKKNKLRSAKSAANVLLQNVEIIQKNGLDFMEISAESPSPYEAALMANSYADVYRQFNLAENREQLTKVKEFLQSQKELKHQELMQAEENIKIYQLQGGSIELDGQASNLIQTLTKFESEKNVGKIEISMLQKTLEELKSELAKKDPTTYDYLVSKSDEPAIKMLQEEISRIETQRAIAITGSGQKSANSEVVKELDQRISKLKKELNVKIEQYQSQIYSSSPEDMRQLTKEIFKTEVELRAKQAENYKINDVVNEYDTKFRALPQKTLEIARLERERQSLEKLYLVLEDKYQEALLNEQSIPGNVLILSAATVPDLPDSPNRIKIVLIGLLAGILISFGFVYIRNIFDTAIKTPEDVKNEGISVLATISKYVKKIDTSVKNAEIIIKDNSEVAAAESYRALRTRIQFSKLDKGSKSILVTSSAPQEGKTTSVVNLAASFAQSGKKVIILDCDLRIPRIHSVFNGISSPGFTNYLFGQVSFADILRKTDVENLFYIASGTIPTNPSEILGSAQMKEFVEKLKKEFDIVLLDSPPIMTITDAEILSHIVDMSILIVFANKTQVDWLIESHELLTKNGQDSFIGVVLNNFDYKSGYRSYHKYNKNKYYERVKESKETEWTKL